MPIEAWMASLMARTAIAAHLAPPGPELPPGVVAGTRARYVEAFERLTEIPFARYLAAPDVIL